MAIIGRLGYEIFFNGRQALMGMSKMERSFNRLKGIVTAVIAGKLVQDVARFGKSFEMMSKRTGNSIEDLSKLRSSFISAGAGAKGFEQVIGKINDGLLGLSMGRGDLAAKLAMFGISPYQGNRLKTEEEVLYSLANWAKTQKDMGTMTDRDILYRFRTLLNIPDELGVKLLEGGDKWLTSAENAQKRIGALTSEEAERLKNLNNQLDEVGETFKVSAGKFVAALEPATDKLLQFTQYAVKQAGENPYHTLAFLLPALLGAGGGLLKGIDIARMGGAGVYGTTKGAIGGGLKGVAGGLMIGAELEVISATLNEIYHWLQNPSNHTPTTWLGKGWDWFFNTVSSFLNSNDPTNSNFKNNPNNPNVALGNFLDVQKKLSRASFSDLPDIISESTARYYETEGGGKNIVIYNDNREQNGIDFRDSRQVENIQPQNLFPDSDFVIMKGH